MGRSSTFKINNNTTNPGMSYTERDTSSNIKEGDDVLNVLIKPKIDK